VGSATGSALDTEFTFRCGEYATDEKSGDIWYSFFERRQDGSRQRLGPRAKTGIYTTVFGATGNYALEVQVSDDAGGQSREVPSMSVAVTENPNAKISDFITSQLQSFNTTKDVREGIKSLGVIMSGLEKLSAASSAFKKKRRSVGVDTQIEVLSMIQLLTLQITLDIVDTGPMIAQALKKVIGLGQIDLRLATKSMTLLKKVAQEMNTNGRDSRSCFEPSVAQDILDSMEAILSALANEAAEDKAPILAEREPILTEFAACLVRRQPCGGTASMFVTESVKMMVGSVDPKDVKSLGLFNVSGLSSALGARSSECIQFRADQNANVLPRDANGTVDGTVLILEFRNATVNGGLRRKDVGGLKEDVPIVFDASQPVLFTVAVDAQTSELISKQNGRPSCVYFDRENVTWSTAGCQVAAFNATHVTCACTHLTEFAISIRSYERTEGDIPGDNPPDNNGPKIIPQPLAQIIGSVAAAGVLVLVASMVAFRKYKHHQMMLK
jgi:hypothetical protein